MTNTVYSFLQSDTNCAFPLSAVVAFRLILVYILSAPVMPLCFNDELCLG